MTQSERPEELRFDVASIPASVRDSLLEAMTAPLIAFYSVPENRRKYEAWLEQRRAAGKVVTHGTDCERCELIEIAPRS